MERLNYEKDKHGFYIIENMEVISHDYRSEIAKSLVKYKDDQGTYYFKSEGEFGDRNKKYNIAPEYLRFDNPYFDGYLAHNDFYMLSELYISKLLPKFGLTSPEYHLAKIGDVYGVVSRDVADSGKECRLLSKEVGLFRHAVTGRSDLEYIAKRTDLPSNVMQKLDILSLFDLTTMQTDRHIGNVILTKDEGQSNYDDFVVIDHANNEVSIHGYMDNIFEDYVTKGSFVTLGVEHTNASKRRYLKDLKKGKYISKDVVGGFLQTLNTVLDSGDMIRDINAELTEEYNIPIDWEYGKKLDYAMRIQARDMEKTYNEM